MVVLIKKRDLQCGLILQEGKDPHVPLPPITFQDLN